MKSYLAYILILVVFVSCEEPFTLDLEQASPKLIIEGLVTDKPSMQSVKVSWSTDFYGSGNTPRVTDAAVSVSDDAGNTMDFVHNPNNHADSMGLYVPEIPFEGVIGRTYKLAVIVNGVTYEAEDKLVGAIPMDSLTYNIDEEEAENPDEAGNIYEVLLFAKEPQTTTNFYLFKFYRNDTLEYDNDTDIYYSDDKFLAENIDGIPAPIFYKKDDLARVEAYSISRVGYVFYNDLTLLLNSDGGMFGPLPASPRTNLSNGALGFFQVSAVNTMSIKIE